MARTLSKRAQKPHSRLVKGQSGNLLIHLSLPLCSFSHFPLNPSATSIIDVRKNKSSGVKRDTECTPLSDTLSEEIQHLIVEVNLKAICPALNKIVFLVAINSTCLTLLKMTIQSGGGGLFRLYSVNFVSCHKLFQCRKLLERIDWRSNSGAGERVN